MALSIDFYSNKDSVKIIKAIKQSNLINNFIELFLLKILFVIIDLVVAIYYITSLFNKYVAFTTFIINILYVCIIIKLIN